LKGKVRPKTAGDKRTQCLRVVEIRYVPALDADLRRSRVTEHIERLFKQGYKRREIVELGFPERVVTRVYRQLRKEKATSSKKEPKRARQEETRAIVTPGSPEEIATIWHFVTFWLLAVEPLSSTGNPTPPSVAHN
jgi:hypothetical protein